MPELHFGYMAVDPSHRHGDPAECTTPLGELHTQIMNKSAQAIVWLTKAADHLLPGGFLIAVLTRNAPVLVATKCNVASEKELT